MTAGAGRELKRAAMVAAGQRRRARRQTWVDTPFVIKFLLLLLNFVLYVLPLVLYVLHVLHVVLRT